MVTQSKVQNASTNIDDKKTLPFQLVIIEGVYSSERKIPITKLTISPHDIPKCTYEVEELKNLKVTLETDENLQVNIVWGSIEEDEDDEPVFGFILSKEQPIQELFVNKNGEEYPWRCGFYHIEVIYNDKIYFGGFKVVPKNVDRKQYQQIYELINKELEGLALDYMKRKQTFSDYNDFEISEEWRFIQWFKNNERKIHQSLSLIEANSSNYLKRNYLVENEPKRIDSRNIKWQNTVKGQIFNNMKYLNRVYNLHTDSDANRLIKYRVKGIIKQVEKVINHLSKNYVNLVNHYNDLLSEINDLEIKRNKLDSYPQVIDRTAIEATLKTKKQELKDCSKLITTNEMDKEKLILSKKALVNRINSNFWSDVKLILPRRTIVSSNIGYQLFNQIWRDSINLFLINHGKKAILPVYQPSYKLNEYYVLLNVINIFRELGFEANGDSIYDQLKNSFFTNGLKSGTNVSMEQENVRIEIIYDEMIETSADLALQKNKNFYSGANSRKPDIRIDCFLTENKEWSYFSSFVVEVKYSPFYNIHNDEGKTRAMKQMSDYWSIMYVRLSNGEKNLIVIGLTMLFAFILERSINR